MDTRTPRTPTGDRSSGYDDAPALSMVKVPSDPAQVIVTHASFRVQLGASSRRARSPRIARHPGALEHTARVPAAPHRRPVVWSGRSAPDDTGAHRLLQAVRSGGVRHGDQPAGDAGATQVLPRIDTSGGHGAAPAGGDLDETVETPVVGAQRGPGAGETRLLPQMRTAGSAHEERTGHHPAYVGPADGADDGAGEHGDTAAPAAGDQPRRSRRTGDDPARHAYYPGRRMNLGVVLLPLRIFLGFVSLYAGMGKLCDPLYFDGGSRGSLVTWLHQLHPWAVAAPLHHFALQHPVGSGLAVAFLQVIVGVLTVLGCWQRLAAVVGALLSAAIVVTVSWRSAPVYDAPDIIYLAAWSPLIIAGAPVYSVDGRLAASAWRRLGPRAGIWDLRRYVLRRGSVLTVLVTGLTLVVGSVLGGAVRDADRVVVPGPGEAPRNELPGSPLPSTSASQRQSASPSAPASPTSRGASSGPSGGPSASPDTGQDRGTATAGTPSHTQGITGRTTPRHSSPEQRVPSTSSGPASGGTATGGGPTGASGTSGATGESGDTGFGGGSSSTGQPGGLVGGLLG
ncbi:MULTISPECIES: DoxX family protein [Streptomyces]|uniref:DoxX family protein n=1 Tax=Streptomyces TaxID=1883 RepID=UPI003868C8D4|nr:DoxX family protein [Streptomyces thermoviolaceus]